MQQLYVFCDLKVLWSFFQRILANTFFYTLIAALCQVILLQITFVLLLIYFEPFIKEKSPGPASVVCVGQASFV